jgi:hypothetical protein
LYGFEEIKKALPLAKEGPKKGRALASQIVDGQQQQNAHDDKRINR